jgi:hypothetical protein
MESKMNKLKFKELENVDNIKDIIKNLFNIDLDISGGWGYTKQNALILNSLDIPMEQFMNLFATLRANIEMNFALNQSERYGGVVLNLQSKDTIFEEGRVFTLATFKISAMNERVYADFIKEYKDNYGKKEFNLVDHFKRRKDQTIIRIIDYWFSRSS